MRKTQLARGIELTLAERAHQEVIGLAHSAPEGVFPGKFYCTDLADAQRTAERYSGAWQH